MACRNCNSVLESLCSDLNVVLEDGRWSHSGGSDMILLEALSKVQRTLHSSKLAHRNIGCNDAASTNLTRVHSEPEEEVGTFFKDPGRPCARDLEQLTIILVSILAYESDYVGHSAGKALLALWQYISDVPSCWTLMLNILWGASKAWFRDSQRDASESHEDSILVALVSLHTLPNISPVPWRNWTAALRDFQVLHSILKICKQEAASKLKSFLNVSRLYIEKIVAAFTKDHPQPSNVFMRHKFEKELALGALLRVLCSIIHSLSLHSDSIKAADFIGESQIVATMETFLPALSFHCLVHSDSTCASSHYVHHKYQMLLFRLREWFTEKPSLAVMCFGILKCHADDLFGTLFQRQEHLTSPLLRSPFAPFLNKHELRQSVPPSTNHIDRHAVLLIFKVVVSLKKGSHHGSTGIDKASESVVLSLEEQCASQVEDWLLNLLSVQIDSIVDISKLEIDKIADGLALSFIDIFVDEDTLMLEMLLLLLDIPNLEIFSVSIDAGDKSSRVTHNMLASIFRPLRLFAVFLFVIQYDHSVIVDFLISKDTSTLCLRYLLRCLPIIQSTWPEFLSLSGKWSDRSCTSKTKRNLQIENTTHGVPSFIRQSQGQFSFMSDIMIDVKKAAKCLLNLKLAVERLHQKHVFPYNPSALLRHLDIFQQLWTL